MRNRRLVVVGSSGISGAVYGRAGEAKRWLMVFVSRALVFRILALIHDRWMGFFHAFIFCDEYILL